MLFTNFSLAFRNFNYYEAYICIPWDVCRKSSISEEPRSQTRKCCRNARTSVTQVVKADYIITPVWKRQMTHYQIDQDLGITREKVLTTNRAIKDLHLEVSSSTQADTRITDCDASITSEDARFRSTASSSNGKLWIPRVFVALESEVEPTHLYQDNQQDLHPMSGS